MTDPRRSNDERLSTADLAAAGERATQRGVDQTQAQRPAQAQPTPPGRPQTDREVMRDAQHIQRADVGTETPGPSATPAPRATADHAHDHDHPTPLFAGNETDEFRHRWNDIQTGFVSSAPTRWLPPRSSAWRRSSRRSAVSSNSSGRVAAMSRRRTCALLCADTAGFSTACCPSRASEELE